MLSWTLFKDSEYAFFGMLISSYVVLKSR